MIIKKVVFIVAVLISNYGVSQHHFQEFRVYPYLLNPDQNHLTINWITEDFNPGEIKVFNSDNDTITQISQPVLIEALNYSALEIEENEKFPDMFSDFNYKHSVTFDNLKAGNHYQFLVKQGNEVYKANFKTAPTPESNEKIRLIVLADSETDPAGRNTYRKWQTGSQHPESTGRPDTVRHYFLTETEGYRENIKFIKKQKPDLILMPGDLVQGGGYQRAWDEFFFHNAGKFDNLFSYVPVLPAFGNWENFGARNGGYHPLAVQYSRAKFISYFDAGPNNNPSYQNCYYRVDYGKITIITLDSSNGLPDSTDADTNININKSTYPGDDLPDFNPGSDQWKWTMEQLQEASAEGQIIFVQFHHIPYSSGGHSLSLSVSGSSGQAGIPMRIYTPYFKKCGVVAVFCGHNESFEHSLVDGIHFFDTGVAGDGFGYSLQSDDPRFVNPWQQWVAHKDEPELWQGQKLISGGKHYGHLQVDIENFENDLYSVTFTPVHIFPVVDAKGHLLYIEKREYSDKSIVQIQK